MNPKRVAFATAAVTFAVVAFACAYVFHIPSYVPIGCYLALLCGLALFERGRYRPNFGSNANWQPTGERFFDPVSGTPTEVFFDPNTGARDYRKSTRGRRASAPDGERILGERDREIG